MREYIVSSNLPGAYASLMEALEAVKADSVQWQPGERATIRIQGIQRLNQPIRIRAEQLPGPEHPILVEGADEISGFSGGVLVTGFHLWRDNIWRAKVPEATYTRHLYIDGKFARRPTTPVRNPFRWERLIGEDYELCSLPSEEVRTIQCANGPRPDEKFEVLDYSGIATTHTEIAQWRNLQDLEMVFDMAWVHRIIPIEWVKPLPDGKLYIRPHRDAFFASRTMEGVQTGACPNYIENVFEYLGKPLEWYFDRQEHMLYVGFPPGDNPENHEIVLPLTEQLLEISGTLEAVACHISFKNLSFSHTTWLHPQKYGMPEVQAGLMKYPSIPKGLEREKPYEGDYQKVISAVRILAARGVSFEGCNFTALGTGALQYEYGTQDCNIFGNRFYEIGGSAVSLGDFYLERAHHPDDPREIVRQIQVCNNYIHHTGRDLQGSVAIMAGYVQDVDISHNDIHNVPYSAISVGWGWGEADVSVGPRLPTPWKTPSVCMRNRISANRIVRCMEKLCDGGAIYTLGCMPGTVISGNYICESSGYQGEGYWGVHISGYGTEEVEDPAAAPFFALHGVPGGIYLDQGSQGIEISFNVLHDVAVPFYYHNQIDKGYTRVTFRDNILNLRPGDQGFPEEIAACAGLEPMYRYLLDATAE